ncbi:unnamed protein product [Choristocarpus tenellus]
MCCLGYSEMRKQLCCEVNCIQYRDFTSVAHLLFLSIPLPTLALIRQPHSQFCASITKLKAVSSRVRNKYGLALIQVSVDQTVGASIINSGFYAFHTLLIHIATGKLFPLSNVRKAAIVKVQAEFWGMMIMNWKIWPIANFVNFSLVPPELRVLFSNLVAVGWNVFLSSSIHS